MDYIRSIEKNPEPGLFKTITTGPCSLEHFKEIKISSGDEDSTFISYFINWIREKNRYIHRIIEVVKYYLIDEHTVITDKHLICINRLPLNVKERRKLPQFGINNEDFGYNTTVSNVRVFLIPIDEDDKKFNKKMNKLYDDFDRKIEYIPLDKFEEAVDKHISDKKKLDITNEAHSELSKITNNILSKNCNSKFKIFKPNIAALKMMDRINEREAKLSASSTKYIPPNAKHNDGSSTCTIVIKNIPTESGMSVNEINQRLKDIFGKYGMIDRVKTLSYRENEEVIIKGIAFIDFYDSDSVDKVLNDTQTRKNIGPSILLVEKKLNKTN